MRIAAIAASVSLVVLAGCSVVPSQAWTYDPTQPQAKAVANPVEAAPLTERVAQLQLERNDIRAQIAAERDAWARQSLYARLHRVGSELSPLERQLGTLASSR
jgi:outer membrane murein-binding lipoprotein Lpp